MKNSKIVEIQMLSYWYVGTGKGTGVGVDSVAFQTQSGLPFWPGKSLKGVFRDAYKQAVGLGHFQQDKILSLKALFGLDVEGTIADETSNSLDIRSDDGRGALRFTDARLAIGEAYLKIERWAQSSGAEFTPYFYDDIPNIAIDENGMVKDKCLRLTQVVKPLTLYAEIEYVGSNEDAERVFNRLQDIFPLIRLMGANRTRGYGQLSMCFQSNQGGK